MNLQKVSGAKAGHMLFTIARLIVVRQSNQILKNNTTVQFEEFWIFI